MGTATGGGVHRPSETGAFYATGSRAIRYETGATGISGISGISGATGAMALSGSTGMTGPNEATASATGVVEDYALELRNIHHFNTKTLTIYPELYVAQAEKTLKLVQREIALLDEGISTASGNHLATLHNAKNWLLKAELNMYKLMKVLHKTVMDVKAARILDRELARLKAMKLDGVIDNAGGKLDSIIYNNKTYIFGDAVFDGYTAVNFGSAEKIFLRVAIARALNIKVSSIELKDAVPDKTDRKLRVAFVLGIRRVSEMDVNARNMLLQRLTKVNSIVAPGLHSTQHVVLIRHIPSPGDVLKQKNDMVVSETSERQLDGLAGVPAKTIRDTAPSKSQVARDTDAKVKARIEVAIEKGTIGNLVKAKDSAKQRMMANIVAQCKNIKQKYELLFKFDDHKERTNNERVRAGLGPLNDLHFIQDATANYATGIYGGLTMASGATGMDATGPIAGLGATSFLQMEGPIAKIEKSSSTGSATGITGAATMMAHRGNKARIAYKKVQASDDRNAELVHAIHLVEEEMERLLEEEEAVQYRQTVQAVADNDYSKLKKHDHMQNLLIAMAKTAKNAAIKLVEKNRKINEHIDGTASSNDVKIATEAAAKADKIAINATRQVEAYKVQRRVRARNDVRRLVSKCTNEAKSWYDYMTKNKEEHRMKKLERERIIEQRQKKEAEMKMKKVAEQRKKVEQAKKVEQGKKAKLAEQKRKQHETLRERLVRLLKVATRKNDTDEAKRLKKQIQLLDLIERAQEEVKNAMTAKKKLLASKNNSVQGVVKADARVQRAIN